jgi:hypothetical protein
LSALLALVSVPALARTPRVHAITGARIVLSPGQVIERGTIVIRDGVITRGRGQCPGTGGRPHLGGGQPYRLRRT